MPRCRGRGTQRPYGLWGDRSERAVDLSTAGAGVVQGQEAQIVQSCMNLRDLLP